MHTRFIKSLGRTARSFAGDRRGNFGIIFGLTSIMLVTASGMAIDYSRLVSAKVRLNMAVDAAVLSTTRQLTSGTISEEDAEELVTRFVFANIDESDFPDTDVVIEDVAIDTSDKTVTVQAALDLPMTISKITGIDFRRVSTSAKAQYSNNQIEVAMALDITGSMGDRIIGSSETRLDALKDAAELGVGDLLKANREVERVRIGLVPYARSVDASPVIGRIETLDPTGGCVIERTGTEALTDHFATFAHPVGAVLNSGHCPTSEIMPMTSDQSALEEHIDDFEGSGWTAGHIAIAWTQYMLSSRWNEAWPAGSDAAVDSDPGTRKYAIIMTDGEFNTFDTGGRDPNDPSSVAASRANALGHCRALRDRGVKVYTIAFTAPTMDQWGRPNSPVPASTLQMMEDCATPADAVDIGSCNSAGSEDRSYFFNAATGDELRDAFEAIARDITCLRLIG